MSFYLFLIQSENLKTLQKIIAYIQASVYNNYRDERSSGESYRISGTDKRVFRCDGYYQEAMQQHSLLCYGGKQARPFLGIVVLVNGSKFCIPFTSNSGKKNKNFEFMRENITFRKICDKNGKVLAALNLNNMIPVRDEYVTEIDLKIHPKDSQELIRWKKLCIKELDWCQSNQAEIERLANELYRIYTSDKPFGKRKICLNFPALEKECNKAKKL